MYREEKNYEIVFATNFDALDTIVYDHVEKRILLLKDDYLKLTIEGCEMAEFMEIFKKIESEMNK